MTPTAVEIGGLGLFVAVLAIAQRLTDWRSKRVGLFLFAVAIGIFVTWSFLFLPTPVAWVVAACAWSVGLWFLHPWVRKAIEGIRKAPAVTILPITEITPDSTVAFRVAGVWSEHAGPEAPWTFKSKLRIALTSDIPEDVDVLAPDWEAEKGDVRIQLPQGFCSLQVEGPKGWKVDDWSGEGVGRLHVQHGQTFRLWIGLDQSFSDADVKQRRELNRLGTLVLPVKVGEKYLEFRQRF